MRRLVVVIGLAVAALGGWGASMAGFFEPSPTKGPVTLPLEDVGAIALPRGFKPTAFRALDTEVVVEYAFAFGERRDRAGNRVVPSAVLVRLYDGPAHDDFGRHADRAASVSDGSFLTRHGHRVEAALLLPDPFTDIGDGVSVTRAARLLGRDGRVWVLRDGPVVLGLVDWSGLGVTRGAMILRQARVGLHIEPAGLAVRMEDRRALVAALEARRAGHIAALRSAIAAVGGPSAETPPPVAAGDWAVFALRDVLGQAQAVVLHRLGEPGRDPDAMAAAFRTGVPAAGGLGDWIGLSTTLYWDGSSMHVPDRAQEYLAGYTGFEAALRDSALPAGVWLIIGMQDETARHPFTAPLEQQFSRIEDIRGDLIQAGYLMP